ncbi:hypothetical protein ACG93R_22220 [Acinetobacter guillouiae]|uniref:hypothetical protein n=1 Tax=Acinetobacter guillouiae TaxID=106649 RepID=UPI003AF7AFB3
MIDMTCQGCEQRREWIRKQNERAKERMRKVLRGLGVIDPAEQQTNRTEQSTHSDQQRTGSTD